MAIGLPFTLIAAWMIVGARSETAGAKESLKATRTDWAIVSVLIAVLAAILYQQLTTTPQLATGDEPHEKLQHLLIRLFAVAAIPFANLSGDPEQEFFADGVTDEISSALARIPDLRVVARQSAYQFKGQNADVQTMNNALGTTHLIGGAVRRDGDRLRINANLVDVSEGAEIWSENFDRIFADVFEIQEGIATAVAGALGMQLGLAPGRNLISSRTTDPEVYRDFLEARELYRARTLDRTTGWE